MRLRECFTGEKSVGVPVKHSTHSIAALQDEVNRVFHSFFDDTLPTLWRAPVKMWGATLALDVTATDKGYVVAAEIPGMDAKDITVTVKHQTITIKGTKEETCKEESNGCLRQERTYGEFQRVVELPESADCEKAEAAVSKGVLTIRIPQKAGAKTSERKLEVRQVA